MHFLVDTNVVIDFLTDRTPFSIEAAKLFDFSGKGKAKLYLAAVSYNNIYYVVRKHSGHSSTIKIMRSIELLTETIDTTRNIISESLDSEFKDFEDAIQYFSALTFKKIDAIITRNISDFKPSKIPILSPEEAIGVLESTAR